MSIGSWDPFGSIERDIDRLMRRSFRRLPQLSEGNGGVTEWSPSADISETEKEYIVRADLPAVKKEDVKVTVNDGVLTLEGERKQKKEERSERVHRTETFYGSFLREFSLPANADANAITCKTEEGVLTIHIPKKTIEKPKQIEVKVQ